MERYNIDLHEHTRLGNILRIVLGILCLVTTGWFIFSINGTPASITTAWIAIAFLFLFAVWMLGSGLGLTDRYITLDDMKIILRENFLKPPVIFNSANLNYVEFRPLTLIFCTGNRKTALKLGSYYPENSCAVMEAVEKFCRNHGIETRGLESRDLKTLL